MTTRRSPRNGLLAVVVDQGPRSPSGLRLFGRPLVAHALESLQAVPGLSVVAVGSRAGAHPGCPTVAAEEPWRPLATAGLVVHDPLCPLLPSSAVLECLALAGPRTTVVGLRPVTDTIKEVLDGQVVGTIDRDRLAALTSPVVVGRDLLDGLAERFPTAGDLADLTAVVEHLAAVGPVHEVQVPSLSRRVSDRDDIALLECLHGLRRTLRER